MKLNPLLTMPFLLVLSTTNSGGSQQPAPEALARRVQPILTNCQTCHSGSSPAGGLNLKSREGALQGGKSGPSYVDGNATASLLLKMVTSGKMPPNKPLSEGDRETVKQWIASGASWPKNTTTFKGTTVVHAGSLHPSSFILHPSGWWSLKPIKAPPLPRVKNSVWVRNPIDAFVLFELESRGLKPAPPADRLTLIRRAAYDLIGLPPTPREIDAFVNDKSPSAYEKMIDRLLASPHYGERWARHWLDVARFSESQGFEYDRIRDHAWRYRDYVVKAFNDDKPYDRFVKEQIAGDAFDSSPSHPSSIAATGFLVACPSDEAAKISPSPAVRGRAREEELEDIISVVGQTFLGLTVNCARCHDHKFDPIPQRDYYRLKAAFDGVIPGNRPLISPEEVNLRLARAEKIEELNYDRRYRIARIEIGARNRVMSRARGAAAATLPKPLLQWTFDLGADDVQTGHPVQLSGGAVLLNGRLKLAGSIPKAITIPLQKEIREKTLEAWVTLDNVDQRGGSVMTIESGNGAQFDGIVFGERQPGKWIAGSDFFNRTIDLDAPKETARPGELIHVAISYSADGTVSVYRNGAPYAKTYRKPGLKGALQSYKPQETRILFGLRHPGAGEYLKGEIEEARLYDRALTSEEVAASYRASYVNLSEQQIDHEITGDERQIRFALKTRLDRRQREIDRLKDIPQAYAVTSKQPEPTYVLIRGDLEMKGDKVTAGGLSAIRSCSPELGVSADSPEAGRRLKLAEWIVNPRNPLTARVMANRVWQYHFGRGIVGTPNDFGFNGERPTHPRLLDWLAAKFVADDGRWTMDDRKHKSASLAVNQSTDGQSSIVHRPSSPSGAWTIKRLHRLIMLSNTYRQSSQFNARAAAFDADNRYLWRFGPKRLEAEAVRDSMLAMSGRLNLEMFGPSFRPFTVSNFNSDFYTLADTDTPAFNRRSIYRIGVQSARNPLLESLDCPDPSTKTPKRTSTVTPLQALELMNNSFVIRQSRQFAERVLKESQSGVNGQVSYAYRLAYGRSPNRIELKRSARLVHDHGLGALCWAILNSTEFLFVN